MVQNRLSIEQEVMCVIIPIYELGIYGEMHNRILVVTLEIC